MPGTAFSALRDCLAEPPSRQTYAAAARALLRELRKQRGLNDGTDAKLKLLYDRRDTMIEETAKLIAAENGLDLTDPLQRRRAEDAVDEALEQWEIREAEDQPPVPTTSLETRFQQIYQHCELISDNIADAAELEFSNEEDDIFAPPVPPKKQLPGEPGAVPLAGVHPELLEKAMTHLSDRERHILVERRLRYSPTTLVDLSQQYGISRTTVHRIELRAFEKLQDAIKAAASTEQRPAAYRFELRGTQIDVLPEGPEAVDAELARDIYRELLAKGQALHRRLIQSNSAWRVCSSVERLLEALGSHFDDLRVGVLLSRERSIAADRAAFDTVEGHGELFADAFAMLDDTLQTLRDLLAAFPIVRRIEAERLALDLDRKGDAIPMIQEEMAAIEATAEKSDAVTKRTVVALRQNDAAIEGAIDPVVKTSLIADKLLVFRNFASAVVGGITSYGRIALSKVGGELGEVGGKSWQAIKDGLPIGMGAAARIAPVVGLVTFAGVIAGPVATVASVVPAFKPIADILRNAVKAGLKGGETGEAKNSAKGRRRGKGR
jgi:hypothetical protein